MEFPALTLLHRCLAGLACAAALPAGAAPPLIAFSPLTPTTLTLPTNSEAIVLYQVTNQSARVQGFQMQPIEGVEFVSGSGHCADPFVLTSQQSCILGLRLIGSEIPGNITSGPVVCIAGNPLQCWNPSPENQLNVTLVPAQVATISATPPSLTLAVGQAGTITVGNAGDSPISAQNLTVDVPPTSSILVDTGTCAAALAPGASCAFQIVGAAAETATELVVSGDDTTTSIVTVTLVDDVIFEDGFEEPPAGRATPAAALRNYDPIVAPANPAHARRDPASHRCARRSGAPRRR